MYSLRLSAEQGEFRDAVREFVNGEVKPVTLKAERLDLGDRSLPENVLRAASAMGLRTLALPEELGGAGADALTCCIVAEELAAGDADIAAVLAETAALGRALFSAMTPAQRDRFLPAFIEDDGSQLALADREPGVETALGVNYHRPAAAAQRPGATAVRAGDGWIVNGTWEDVGNAGIAKLFAVLVHADDGPALFLVSRDAAGLTVTEQSGRRWYHGSRGRMALKDCRVSADSRLPADAATAAHAVPWPLALNLGIGRAAYEAAIDYAKLRVQGGRPIVEHQAIGAKLADAAIRLEAARALIWRAAWAADHPEAVADRSLPDLPHAAVAEAFAAEAIYRATKDCAECFGAMGVMRDMPLQKYITDARICLYNGDGNADLKLRIAEALASYRRNPAMLAAE